VIERGNAEYVTGQSRRVWRRRPHLAMTLLRQRSTR
jgi:hypothetical protein